MALRSQPLVVVYKAFNAATNQYQTHDGTNHTLRAIGDGAVFIPSNAPVEVDPTFRPGYYSLALIAGEMNYNFVDVGGISSTANVILIGPQVVTERGVLPNVPPAAQGQPLVAANYAPTVVHSGTAQGGSVNTITLDAGASGTTNYYNGCRVRVVSGTGLGQERTVIGYNATSKVATVDWNWEVNPDITSGFAVVYGDEAALNSALQPSVNVSIVGTVNANVVSYAAGFSPDSLVWSYRPISTRTSAQLLRYAAATAAGALANAATSPALYDTDQAPSGTPMIQYTMTDPNGSRTVVINS